MKKHELPLLNLDSEDIFNKQLLNDLPSLLLVDLEPLKKELEDKKSSLYETFIYFFSDINLEIELMKISENEYKITETNNKETLKKLDIETIIISKYKRNKFIIRPNDLIENGELLKCTDLDKENIEKISSNIENCFKLKTSITDTIFLNKQNYDVTFYPLNSSDIILYIKEEKIQLLNHLEQNFRFYKDTGEIIKDKNYTLFSTEYNLSFDSIKMLFDDILTFKEMEEKISRNQIFGTKKQLIINDMVIIIIIIIDTYNDLECRVSILKADEVEIILKEHKEEDLMSDVEDNFESKILHMLAHQWRQPLTNVSLELDMLKMTLEEEELNEEVESVNDITKEIKKLSNTIHNFSEVLGTGSNKTEKTTYRNIVDKTLKLMEEELLNNFITINTSYSDFTLLNINQAEITKILIMLINNSVESLTFSETSHKEIRIHIQEDNEYIEILVIDNGGGFDFSQYSEHDFLKPYVSTRGLNEKGIGLYMVNKILKKIQGKIFLYNTNEKKNCFFSNNEIENNLAIVKIVFKKG